jgi:hypothetical protein
LFLFFVSLIIAWFGCFTFFFPYKSLKTHRNLMDFSPIF